MAWRGPGTAKRSGSRARASALRGRSGLSPATEKERLLVRTPAELTIQDVTRDGRILMTSDNGKVGIIGRPPGSEKDRDLSLLDWSLARDLSSDGKLLLFDESGEGGGAHHAIYVRKTDGSPAVRLGDGWAAASHPTAGGLLRRAWHRADGRFSFSR